MLLLLLGCSQSTPPIVPPNLHDTIPPSPPARFAADSASTSTIALSWIASGDDSTLGTAAVCEIRMSRERLTDTTSIRGIPVAAPRPLAAGTRQIATVDGLESGVDYYFAIRSGDEIPNWSPYAYLGPVSTLPDTIPPARVTDLRCVRGDSTSLTFWWAAPGDDGNQGRAARYDIRYSTTEITPQNFADALAAPSPINIFTAGVVQDIKLTHLLPRTTYYIALRVYDDVANVSMLSNCAHSQTDRGFKNWRVTTDGHGDANSIQAGIDSARSGETVFIAPGTYHEAINFKGKAVSVVSEQGYAVTTVDATGTQKATVTFATGESHGSLIEGLTVTGGSKGGILIDHTSPTIRRNRICDNPEGGGVSIHGFPYGLGPSPVYSPVIEYNVIENNTQQQNGGGIGADGLTCLRLIGNIIRRNRTLMGDGGGLNLDTWADDSLIEDNDFYDNIAGDHAGAIAVGGRPGGSTTVCIQFNRVFRNVAYFKSGAGGGGGALWLLDTKALVQRNTFVGNTIATATVGSGTAFSLQTGGAPRFIRNIIAYQGQGSVVHCQNGVAPHFEDNIFWSNNGVLTSTACAQLDSLAGSVDIDPLLCDPGSGDLRVSVRSPALLYRGSAVGAYSEAGCSSQ